MISPPDTPVSETALACPICQEPIESDHKLTECGHEFHSTCLSAWGRVSATCPVCRAGIGNVEIEVTDVPVNLPRINFTVERNVVSMVSGMSLTWYILVFMIGSDMWYELVSLVCSFCGLSGALTNSLCLLSVYLVSWPLQVAGLVFTIYSDIGTRGPSDEKLILGALYYGVCCSMTLVGFWATYRLTQKLWQFDAMLREALDRGDEPVTINRNHNPIV